MAASSPPAAALNARRRLDLVGPALVAALMLPVVAGVGSTLNAEGLERYRAVWLDARGWSIFGRSLGFGAMVAGWALLAAWPVAAWASRLRAGARYAVLALAALPVALPGSLLAVGWVMALGRDGVVTHWLGAGDPWLTVYDRPVAAAAIGLRYFGLAALPLAFELRRLRRRRGLDRAFALPAPTRWWWLTARPMLPAAATGFALVLLFAANDHVMASMLLVPTYGTQVLIALNTMLDAREAMVLAAPMALLGIAAGVVAARRLRGTGTGETREAFDNDTGHGLATAGAALVVFALALGVPLVALVAAGWALARSWLADRRAGGFALPAVLLVNLVLPGAVLAIGAMRLFEAEPLVAWRDTAAPLVFAQVARFTPLVALLLFAAGRRESTAPRDAAKAFGLGPLTIVRRIDWPGQRFRLAMAALAVTLVVATELEVAVLLAPAGRPTMGVRLYTMIHTAPDALVSATALAYALALGGVLIAAGGAASLHRRNGARRG